MNSYLGNLGMLLVFHYSNFVVTGFFLEDGLNVEASKLSNRQLNLM